MSRTRTLYLVVPGGLVLGGWAIGGEIVAHGFSDAVLAGLVGGILCSAAVIALVATHWNRTITAAELQQSERLRARTKPFIAPLGLAGAGIAAAVGALGSGGERSLGSALMVACGVVFVVGAGITAAAVIGRRGLFS